jgi:hypothetical protein
VVSADGLLDAHEDSVCARVEALREQAARVPVGSIRGLIALKSGRPSQSPSASWRARAVRLANRPRVTAVSSWAAKAGSRPGRRSRSGTSRSSPPRTSDSSRRSRRRRSSRAGRSSYRCRGWRSTRRWRSAGRTTACWCWSSPAVGRQDGADAGGRVAGGRLGAGGRERRAGRGDGQLREGAEGSRAKAVDVDHDGVLCSTRCTRSPSVRTAAPSPPAARTASSGSGNHGQPRRSARCAPTWDSHSARTRGPATHPDSRSPRPAPEPATPGVSSVPVPSPILLIQR